MKIDIAGHPGTLKSLLILLSEACASWIFNKYSRIKLNVYA